MSIIWKRLLRTASNHEANTPFTAEKAIDGNPDTRWATDRDVVKPTIEFKLEKTTLIKHVEIDWDRRVRGEQNDPNIKSWNLYYAGQDEVNGSGPGEWKLAHQRTGTPVLDEKVDLKEAVQAKYLKLEITDYQSRYDAMEKMWVFKKFVPTQTFQTPANQQIFVKLQK